MSSYATRFRFDVPEEPSAEALIVCPVSRWYFRRIALVAALFGGLALYFFYDGAYGYPRTNFHADLFDAFEAGKKGESFASLDFATDPDRTVSERQRSEMEEAHATGSQGGSWAAFAATRHLGEARPERHSADSIRQQFVFGWILVGLTFVAAGYGLIQRSRCLRAGIDWLETPPGKRIPFSEITGVDFAKWDRGIAILEVSQNQGATSQVKIDDYRFSGASEIIKRIGNGRPEIRSAKWPKSVCPGGNSSSEKE